MFQFMPRTLSLMPVLRWTSFFIFDTSDFGNALLRTSSLFERRVVNQIPPSFKISFSSFAKIIAYSVSETNVRKSST